MTTNQISLPLFSNLLTFLLPQPFTFFTCSLLGLRKFGMTNRCSCNQTQNFPEILDWYNKKFIAYVVHFNNGCLQSYNSSHRNNHLDSFHQLLVAFISMKLWADMFLLFAKHLTSACMPLILKVAYLLSWISGRVSWKQKGGGKKKK